MENKEYLKVRSMTACMKTSYEMMTEDVRGFVKKTWKSHLPLAVLMAVVLYFLQPNKALHDWGVANAWTSSIIQTAVYALTIAMVVLCIVCTFPFKRLHRRGEKKSPVRAAGRIVRHSGGFLATLLLGGLLLCIVVFVAALPSFVVIAVQLQSQLGAMEGDPLGVPSYFIPLMFAVFIISSLIVVYAVDWLGFSLAYQYGSYKKQDEERKMLNQEKNHETDKTTIHRP